MGFTSSRKGRTFDLFWATVRAKHGQRTLAEIKELQHMIRTLPQTKSVQKFLSKTGSQVELLKKHSYQNSLELIQLREKLARFYIRHAG